MRRSAEWSGIALGVFLAAALPMVLAATPAEVAKGKEKYLQVCAACHGADGKGDGPAAANLPLKPQDHTNGKTMNALTDDDLFKVIKNGGSAVGKSPFMPPMGTQLSDQEVRDVIAYVRTLAVPPYLPKK